MPTFNISNIIEINKDGLFYKDNDGNKCFIDFLECRKNWTQYVNESRGFTTWDGAPVYNISTKDTQCVGQRDWFDKKPYFEFFSNPHIKFEIVRKRKLTEIFNKNWYQRYYNSFYSIQKLIYDYGWSTFDLG